MFGRPKPEIKTTEQLLVMRRAGLVVARTLTAVRDQVRPGVSTAELDQVAAEVISSAGAQPSFLGYGADRDRPGFPGVICTSVNDEIIHGIPGDRRLQSGDLISVDCGAIVDGWHGDAAITVGVGELAPEREQLSEGTRDALWMGIGVARLGGRVGDISAAVEDRIDALEVEHGRSYGIVTEYVGHGIGSAMHQDPDVPNVGRAGRGTKIRRGLALAIEPMITLGSADNHVAADGWTVITDDGSPAAHWEHTITLTDHGIWVLTAEDGGEAELGRRGLPFGPLAN
ncbi:type I methionyl aminopeptidase [Microlunatus endophyticus]|nr:type I methionyl aminopeptidase [Microlunatus endophyticus]